MGGGNPSSGVCTPIKALPFVQVRLCLVPVTLCSIQAITASSLAKMMSAVSLASAHGAASSSVLAVLPSAAKAAAVVIGGVVAVGSVPVVLSAVGFTSAGIAASSLAAKMMSAAAIANGGGVAAGSLVATLQSVGVAGLSLTTKLIVGSAGSVLMAYMV